MTAFKFQGTGQTTGPDPSVLIQAVLIIAAAVGLVMILVEYAALIIAAAAVVLIARGWFAYRQVLAIRNIAAAGERMRAEQRAHASAALADQRVHEIAVAEAQGRGQAAASAAMMAPLVAAITAAMPQFQPQPEPVRVVRAEVER